MEAGDIYTDNNALVNNALVDDFPDLNGGGLDDAYSVVSLTVPDSDADGEPD